MADTAITELEIRTNTGKSITFDYETAKLEDLTVHTSLTDKGKEVIDSVEVDGEKHDYSSRFFTSMFSRYQFNRAFFKYYTYPEVFERVAEVNGNDTMRLCIERSEDKDGNPTSRLMAMSSLKKPIVDHEQLVKNLLEYRGRNIQYNDGIIISTHEPRRGASPIQIAGDNHSHRFIVQTPIDGYGLPSTFLALQREACKNQLSALSKMFKATISVGKGDDNINFALMRCFDQFNNEEGYAALRQRVESAANSWASVLESQKLYKLLASLHGEGLGGEGAASGLSLKAMPMIRKSLLKYQSEGKNAEIGEKIMTAFHGMTGDVSELYGIANVDAFSIKSQMTMPVNCTVYDIIQFATELATHYTTPHAAQKIDAFIGRLVSDEFDMEGTKEEIGEFADFHMRAKLQTGATGS